ncbi:serine/threonine protein kinase [Ktedonosporobacter rubrisoli]|uniref:non-specific serine/threonine protein kinase n=1 Tax=Ktedonosporobacter rubrisoli TaxID=2509675 RepID=A0A4P6K152_KTERU|nr:serine/threonine-protein kinase [Ktedonosporobacter rubrisoli]QBD81705.1 serine/threonine protein kinase [Ktedonosporobacter rubrisoli]
MQPDKMGGTILGHYRILHSLGYGGTATVFLAQDINLQREVAIKVFQPGTGEMQDFLRRFAREARVLAQLDHPHILPVYDYGEQETIACLVIPYMPGGSLRDRLRELGPVPIQQAIKLAGQILDALQYAHNRGLIHRDIKPGNMLFKADGTLLLSDFGLVKITSSPSDPLPLQATESTISHTIAGTPDYMAPEQITGQPTFASDIYSMGIVLYEMLTGKRPFNADNYIGVFMQHLHEQPAPLYTHNPQISAALNAAIMRALSKEPGKRYQSCNEFRQALEQALSSTKFPPEPLASFSTSSASPQPNDTNTQIISQPLAQQPRQIIIPHPDTRSGTPTTSIEATLSSGSAIYASSTAPIQHPVSPSTHPHAQKPLIIILICIILALVISLGTILYSGGYIDLRIGRQPGGSPSSPISSATTVTKGGITTNPGVATGNQLPVTATNCPPEGVARAPLMPPFISGKNPNLAYIVDEGTSDKPLAATLKLRDVTSDLPAQDIIRLPTAYISEAQLSRDGQWVLFTVQIAGQMQLRLIRVDGLAQQTLYCAPVHSSITHSQWSFNQQQVVFNAGQDKPITYLLNLATGVLQPELIPQANLSYIPRTWQSNTAIYMTTLLPNANASGQDIYILDTRKGANQHDGDLQKVATTPLACNSFDSSYDVSQLFMSQCTPAATQANGPSVVTVQPATGGTAKMVYSNANQAITAIRSVSPTTLLLLIENQAGDSSQNGLWKMSVDGKELNRLTTDNEHSQALCPFTQYAWSNISNDEAFYALQSFNSQTHTYSMVYGSLKGGPLHQFASIDDGTQLYLVGWTHI